MRPQTTAANGGTSGAHGADASPSRLAASRSHNPAASPAKAAWAWWRHHGHHDRHPAPPPPPIPPHAAHVKCCAALDAPSLFSTPHFSDADWDRQRSWKRLLPHSAAVFARVFAFYYPPLVVTALISLAVGLYETLGPPRHPGWPTLSGSSMQLREPFALTSFVLGLLLVFKTNAAYDRWKEAREAWGGLLGDVRSLAREVCAWSGTSAGGRRVEEAGGGGRGGGSPPDPTALADSLAWTAALCYTLRRHLGRDDAAASLDEELARELGPLLHPAEVAWLLSSGRRPSAAALALSAALARLPVSDMLLQALEARVHAYSSVVVACERLRRQPVPVAYSRHAGRFLTTWLAGLPFVFWGEWGWGTLPMTVIITFLTSGVDNIGAQLEQPFDVLPLALFARTAHADVSEAAGAWAGLKGGAALHVSTHGGHTGGGGLTASTIPPPPPPAPESAGGASENDPDGAGV